MNLQTYRRKFILIAMSAMTACLVIVLLMLNLLNFSGTIAAQKDILSIIAENDGTFPPFGSPGTQMPPPRVYQITEESEYQIRYFYVTVEPKGDVSTHLKRIAAVDEAEATLLAQKAAAMNREYGFIGHYIFKAYTSDEGQLTRIVFLDWADKLNSLKGFAAESVLMGLGGITATFLIVLWLSKRAIRPVVISTQKQQQFITDASHELKTPLSAISVNMEVLELENGGNKWIDSTKEQLGILRSLVEQLISIARMDEEASLYGKKQPLNMSELVDDAVTCFIPVAEAAGRTLDADIPGHVEISGNEELLRRMLSVLCDNAIQHSSGEGCIRLSLAQRGKTITLRVQNPYPVQEDSTFYERMFDRFYKADPARSKDSLRNGFGVGLSIAQNAAQWHGGAIKASPVGKDQICFTVTLRRK